MSKYHKCELSDNISGKCNFILLITLVFTLISQIAYCRDYYVSPDGNDSDTGTMHDPFKTISKAIVQSHSGDNIFLREGLYSHSQTIYIYNNGLAGKMITLQAYENEIPILDFNNVADDAKGIALIGNYWHLKNLIIRYAGDNGLSVYGSHNIIEQIAAHNNGDSGLRLHTDASYNLIKKCDLFSNGDNGLRVYGSHNILEQITTHKNGDTGLHLHTGASYNLIKNCDSYLNYDPENYGENADGFGAKFDVGPGNKFTGCRASWNSDDGYDFWMAGNGVNVENCWAFNNGENIWHDSPFTGNGNGFKLGKGEGGHILIRCLAYDHPHNGFDYNGNTTGVSIYNCTSIANDGRNYRFDVNSVTHILRNNISYLGSDRIYEEIDDRYNSWNILGVTDRDFVSTDPNGIDGPRDKNGNLPKLSFFRLSPISQLIDAGIDVGISFEGDAPDLGAFEFITGDCEFDGDVDAGDLSHLSSNWLNTERGTLNGADLDGNHRVDFYDFAKLASNWLKN